jgi:hypothetical protein
MQLRFWKSLDETNMEILKPSENVSPCS